VTIAPSVPSIIMMPSREKTLTTVERRKLYTASAGVFNMLVIPSNLENIAPSATKPIKIYMAVTTKKASSKTMPAIWERLFRLGGYW